MSEENQDKIPEVASNETKAAAEEKNTKWYVLRVVSGKEKKVKEYLDKDIIREGWDKDILQIFLPVEKVYKVVNGKKVMRERNFYLGYVMIEVIDGKLTGEMVQHPVDRKSKDKQAEDTQRFHHRAEPPDLHGIEKWDAKQKASR